MTHNERWQQRPRQTVNRRTKNETETETETKRNEKLKIQRNYLDIV